MRDWVPPAAGGAVLLMLTSTLFAAPALGAHAADDLTRAPTPWLPEPARSTYEDWRTRSIDAAFRFFAGGDPDRLVEGPMRLRRADPMPGQWHGARTLSLEWNDLGHEAIRYEVLLAAYGQPFEAARTATVVDRPAADLIVAGDGSYGVWVRPHAGRNGPPSGFGPFLVDASPPPAPTLSAPLQPRGYRFELRWSASQDDSGIASYELERRRGGGAWEHVARSAQVHHTEDQVGNGDYEYRVRAVNGAGVPSAWSASVPVVVRALMQNPGAGQRDYGIHANYTGLLHLWDLSDPQRYLDVNEVPAGIRASYLQKAPAIETDNATLQALVRDLVGPERNTLRIAEKLFIFLFDHADYDSEKLQSDFDPDDPTRGLQRAGHTLDRGKGICGDLAVLYITLLRIAQIPARPVHGYLDNPRAGVGGFHMWVEVYVGPVDDAHAWLTVDVSGINGAFRPELLFAYFGLFNPDYLALGTEMDYGRYPDGQWNTWARYRYVVSGADARPQISDRTTVVEYEQEYGRLFFNTATRRTTYRACIEANARDPDNPCPNEPAPSGFSRYYGIKRVAKKRIDYGADLSGGLPACVRVELRAPIVDAAAAVTPDQSVIYRAYAALGRTQFGPPDADGWVTFLDGRDPDRCRATPS